MKYAISNATDHYTYHFTLEIPRYILKDIVSFRSRLEKLDHLSRLDDKAFYAILTNMLMTCCVERLAWYLDPDPNFDREIYNVKQLRMIDAFQSGYEMYLDKLSEDTSNTVSDVFDLEYEGDVYDAIHDGIEILSELVDHVMALQDHIWFSIDDYYHITMTHVEIINIKRGLIYIKYSQVQEWSELLDCRNI